MRSGTEPEGPFLIFFTARPTLGRSEAAGMGQGGLLQGPLRTHRPPVPQAGMSLSLSPLNPAALAQSCQWPDSDMEGKSLLLAKPGLGGCAPPPTPPPPGSRPGDYLWQLGLEAGLLSQCVIDGLQEAPLHHIKGLEAEDREGCQGTGQFKISPSPDTEMRPINSDKLCINCRWSRDAGFTGGSARLRLLESNLRQRHQLHGAGRC